MNFYKAIIAVILGFFLFVAASAIAQTSGLTPQQELMLNQLPPAQRQQALEALQQNKSGPALRVGVPVRETVDSPSTALSPAIASFPVVETLRASANSRQAITNSESVRDE